jgi:coatomer subunit beta
MLIMTSIIRVGQSQFVSFPIDEDSYDRIMQDLRVVGTYSQANVIEKVYLEDTKLAYAKQIQDEEVREWNDLTHQPSLLTMLTFLSFLATGGGG